VLRDLGVAAVTATAVILAPVYSHAVDVTTTAPVDGKSALDYGLGFLLATTLVTIVVKWLLASQTRASKSSYDLNEKLVSALVESGKSLREAVDTFKARDMESQRRDMEIAMLLEKTNNVADETLRSLNKSGSWKLGPDNVIRPL